MRFKTHVEDCGKLRMYAVNHEGTTKTKIKLIRKNMK